MSARPRKKKSSRAAKAIPRIRQTERTELSEQRLMDAAIELLVKTGIQNTTLQQVGLLAGYSRGLATHRFGSKAGLFAHVLKVASADWLQRVQSAVGSRVGADALVAATDAAHQFIRERTDAVRAMYLLWFLSIDPGKNYQSNLSNVHRAQRRDATAWILAGQKAGLVNAAAEPARVAEQYCAAMAGIIYQWLVCPDLSLEEMFGQLKANFLTLLRP
jgi:AcrR family transcriptional regulator